MYNFNLYRLTELPLEELRQRVLDRIKHPVTPPIVAGHQADLASAQHVFFLAEDSDRIAATTQALLAFAQEGHQCIWAVPEPLKENAREALSYFPPGLYERVRILPVPLAPSLPT